MKSSRPELLLNVHHSYYVSKTADQAVVHHNVYSDTTSLLVQASLTRVSDVFPVRDANYLPSSQRLFEQAKNYSGPNRAVPEQTRRVTKAQEEKSRIPLEEFAHLQCPSTSHFRND